MTSGTLVHTPASGRARWVFVVCDAFIAMVDAGASPETIQRLWAMTDATDPTVEDLVGTIPLAESTGGGGVVSFAIVRFAEAAPIAPDRAMTAVVRGDACVDVFSIGGARRFGAGGVEPWVLAGFRSVVAVGVSDTRVEARSTPALPPGALPIEHAAIAAERVLWAHPSVAIADESTLDTDAARAVDPQGTEPHGLDSHGADSHGADPYDLDRTLLRIESALIVPPPDTVQDDTVLLSRSGTRTVPAERDPAERDASEHRPARFTLVIGSTPPQALTGPIVIGRKPAVGRVPVIDPPTLVTVASPEGEVSQSHVRVEPQGDAVVVTDLRSTNGTYVKIPGLPRRRIHPGESFTVPGRARIEIGDGNIIEITPIVTDRQSGQPATAAGGPR